MTVFSTEMTEIISGFDAKMTRMTQSVIKLKLNNTRYYQASIGQPCYQSCETANNDTGPLYVSRTELARDLPVQANPGAKLQLIHS